MNNIVSVNDTAYSDLGEASESAYHDTPFETKLVSQQACYMAEVEYS